MTVVVKVTTKKSRQKIVVVRGAYLGLLVNNTNSHTILHRFQAIAQPVASLGVWGRGRTAPADTLLEWGGGDTRRKKNGQIYKE